MARLGGFLGLLVGLAGVGEWAVAQSGSPWPEVCTTSLLERLADSEDPTRYSVREGGYCDGAAITQNTGNLQIVSATFDRVTLARPIAELSANGVSAYRIRGWDLREGGTYRLDGTLKDGPLAVDTQLAIQPLGLSDDMLGFIAWIDQADGRKFAPVSTGSDGPVILIFMSSRPIYKIVRAQVCEAGAGDCLEVENPPIENRDNSALVRLTLPTSLEPAEYSVDLVVRERRPRPARITVRLVVP